MAQLSSPTLLMLHMNVTWEARIRSEDIVDILLFLVFFNLVYSFVQYIRMIL
jgi:hypothetical protein